MDHQQYLAENLVEYQPKENEYSDLEGALDIDTREADITLRSSGIVSEVWLIFW